MPINTSINLDELEKIANDYGTPYYLYDKEMIKKRATTYMITFKRYFPNFEQYYAVKALPNPSILKILKKCGMGFDCSSPEEIQIVRLMEFFYLEKSKIMYTSNYTSVGDLKKISEYSEYTENIIVNLDSIDGFYNLLETNESLPDTICFRYNPVNNNISADIVDGSTRSLLLNVTKLNKKINNKNDKKNIENNIKSNIFSGNDTKFGMTKKYLFEAYKLAKTHHIQNFGIHVMSQSNCLDVNYWDNLIDDIFDVIHELYVRYSIIIEFIDIGGGIGIPYKPDEQEINLEELVSKIRERFDFNIQKYNLSEPKLFTECGRYITGPFGWLVSRCQSIKETDNGIFYGLDANMANLMRPGMYNAYHHITIPRLPDNKNDTIEGNVVGTLCENNDWFCKNRILPNNIKKGDLFVIHDCGAHAYSMGFNYNSKLHCPELLYSKNNIKEIRKREDMDYHLQNTLIWKNINNYIKNFICFGIIILFGILYLLFI